MCDFILMTIINKLISYSCVFGTCN